MLNRHREREREREERVVGGGRTLQEASGRADEDVHARDVRLKDK